MADRTRGARGRLGGGVLGVLLAAVLVGFTAQQLLTPVLAPLSRELRLTEFHLGLVITVAAVVFTLGSLFWGRVVDSWGSRRVLLTGLALGVAGLAAFAVVSHLALTSGWATPATLTAMLATRSVLFGAGIGAVPVAALAHVAAATEGARERTRAVSLVGAAQALSLVLGPGVGGALAVAGLLLPVYAAPVLLALVTFAVAVLVPRRPGRDPATPAEAGAPPGAPRVGPLDPRVRPFLIVGFLLFLSLGVMQVVLGFLVQDRLGLDGTGTAGAVGIAMFVTGLVLVAMQAVIVPRMGWTPARLLRTGAPVAAVGFAGLALAPQLWSITAGLAVIAVGLGMALPGYTAGATLRVGRGEQGSVAGLVNATNGTTFIVGPLLGTALYGAGSAVPIWAGAASCVLAALVAVTHRGVAAVAAPVPAATEG